MQLLLLLTKRFRGDFAKLINSMYQGRYMETFNILLSLIRGREVIFFEVKLVTNFKIFGYVLQKYTIAIRNMILIVIIL